MPKIETGTRTRVATFLPTAIETALGSYQSFSGQIPLEEAGKFKAHHDACKVALAHIELLIKLAEWAHLPDPQGESEENTALLQYLIETAQKEVGEDSG